ncbi:MAG: adenosylcobinamide-GDP ribazoletransferase [Solirubrobacteraceae bacterium]
MRARTESATATRRPRRPWTGLAGAITFLTIAPLPTTVDAELASSAGWFPVVGAALGALAGGVRVLCEPLLGRTVGTVLAMIVLVVATGALHLDGLADTADGLGVRGDRAKRLEVMRDSATGVFGTLALVGWALLLLTTVASLDSGQALAALTAACAFARWAALLHAAALSPARSDGLGAAFHVSRLGLSAATAASVIAALAICGLDAGAAALGTTMLIAALWAAFARRTLGGRTGDTLGVSVAMTEVVVCTVLLAAWQG